QSQVGFCAEHALQTSVCCHFQLLNGHLVLRRQCVQRHPERKLLCVVLVRLYAAPAVLCSATVHRRRDVASAAGVLCVVAGPVCCCRSCAAQVGGTVRSSDSFHDGSAKEHWQRCCSQPLVRVGRCARDSGCHSGAIPGKQQQCSPHRSKLQPAQRPSA